tara:strand:+ start:34714 stop:35238 length:525 start_codon:yes stop_codon:yes gene_type:complete
MKLYSGHYQNQLRKLHQLKSSFGSAGKYKGLNEWIDKWKPQSLTDYGCGKGNVMIEIGKRYPECELQGYDPGVLQYNKIPEFATDLLMCTDVLEHIEPEMIDNVLQHINTLFKKSAFLLIDTREAIKTLPDGRNAHLIIEGKDWWTEKVTKHIKGNVAINAWQKQQKILIVVNK